MFYTRAMSKKPKKRTKRYSGEDAKRPPTSAEPVIHRYEAVERSRVGEWWQSKKRLVRIGAIAAAIVGGATWLIVELLRAIF